jgi:hypothetical protein
MPSGTDIWAIVGGKLVADRISREAAEQVAADVVKKKKNTEKVDVATVDKNDDEWVVRGTCPIDMEGHPWTEQFEIVLSSKGKVKSMDTSLL